MSQFRSIASSLETWILVEMGLGLFASLNTYNYNFPLFILGLYAFHNHETTKLLKVFGVFLFLSVAVDITAMAYYSRNLQYASGMYKFSLSMTIIGIIFKPVVAILLINTLQQRGVELPFQVGGFGGGGYQANDSTIGSNVVYQPISNPAPYIPPKSDPVPDSSRADDGTNNYQTL